MRVPEGFTGLDEHSTKRRVRCCIEGCNYTVSVFCFGMLPFVVQNGELHDLTQEIFFCRNHWPDARRNKLNGVPRRPGSALEHLVIK